MNKNKLAKIFTLAFAVSLLLCIGLRVITGTMKIDYQEVKVTVISGSQSVGRTTKTDFKVNYKGEEHKLYGVTNIWKYSIGQDITVYMSNGKLYEETNDVRGGTGVFIASMIFMGITIVLLVPMLTFWIELNKEKKRSA